MTSGSWRRVSRTTRLLLGGCAVLLMGFPAGASRQPVTLLPPWTPGTLDIHHIATGEGNATFFVLPDGTTMLVDAGAATAVGRAPLAPPVPDASRRAGERIAQYARRMMPAGREPVIDYALLTHFHGDHMGFISPESPTSRHGDYRLAGITDVAESLTVRTVLDRGWPTYDYPEPIKDASVENYRRFLAARSAADGLKVERFESGRDDQISLVRNRGAYPEFTVQNLSVNGEVWTGSGHETRRAFPPIASIAKQDWPTENICSLAFLMTYGTFTYFSGGDLQGVPPDGFPAWHDVETPIAKAIGNPVDVVLVNHHGSIEPMNAFFLSTLRPRVDVVPAWSTTHPAPVVLKRLLNERIYSGPRDIFVLEFRDATKATIGPRADEVKSDHGHVVVRVTPGGGSYQVFVLDSRTEGSTRVLATHGPYPSS